MLTQNSRFYCPQKKRLPIRGTVLGHGCYGRLLPRGWLLGVAVPAAAVLGEDLGGHRAVEAVLQGDGFHGGGGGEGQRGAVEGARSGRGGAVGGVADLRAALSAHGHRGALGKGRRAADGGGIDGRGAGAARAGVAAGHGEGCRDGGREGEARGGHAVEVEHEALLVGARLAEGAPGVLRLGFQHDAVPHGICSDS